MGEEEVNEGINFCHFCGASHWDKKGKINFKGSDSFDVLFNKRRHNYLCYTCKKNFIIFG